jgi:DNA-binding MarR family transcriptional regulator
MREGDILRSFAALRCSAASPAQDDVRRALFGGLTSPRNRQYIDDMRDRDLVAGVVQLGNLLTRKLAPAFAKLNVTPQQWAVLSVLESAEAPLSLAEIAREMLVSKQNMTGMATRLEQLGLIERAGDPRDLRASRISLTRRGRSAVEKLRPAYEQWLESMVGGSVSERDLQALTKTVNRLIAALEETES